MYSANPGCWGIGYHAWECSRASTQGVARHGALHDIMYYSHSALAPMPIHHDTTLLSFLGFRFSIPGSSHGGCFRTYAGDRRPRVGVTSLHTPPIRQCLTSELRVNRTPCFCCTARLPLESGSPRLSRLFPLLGVRILARGHWCRASGGGGWRWRRGIERGLGCLTGLRSLISGSGDSSPEVCHG